jgi:FixJ family two-component response regulator
MQTKMMNAPNDIDQKLSIAIIDDDSSIRKSLARLIGLAGYEARTFALAREFLDSPVRDQVACIVSDLRMPGLDGLELQQAVSRRLPHLSIVFITGAGDISSTVTAMKAGAVDFLEKPIKGSALLEAIDRAIERSRKLKAANVEILELQVRHQSLTARERQVFGLVTAGLLNKQVAAELGAAEKTIKHHRGRVMIKMEAESLADLVLMAERLGVRPIGVDFSKAKGQAPTV